MVEISLKAEELFHIGSFPVTNSVVLGFIVFLVFAVLGWRLRRKIELVPGKFQALFELIVEGILKLMESVLHDRRKSEKYLPLIATIFIAVTLSNWIGLFPGVGSIGIHTEHEGKELFVPLFRAPAADLNFTLGLALISVIATNVFGALAVGFKHHFGKFFTLKNPINTFVGLLEFVAEFAKMISFSFRLFGNVFAGEVLLIVIGALVPYFIPLPFMLLELFVGFIQAFIFAMLTLVFISIATTEGEH